MHAVPFQWEWPRRSTVDIAAAKLGDASISLLGQSAS